MSSTGQGSTGNVIAAICSLFIPGLGQLVQALADIERHTEQPLDDHLGGRPEGPRRRGERVLLEREPALEREEVVPGVHRVARRLAGRKN